MCLTEFRIRVQINSVRIRITSKKPYTQVNKKKHALNYQLYKGYKMLKSDQFTRIRSIDRDPDPTNKPGSGSD